MCEKEEITSNMEDYSDVLGQLHAKRALVIAAAGMHNILLMGPPGLENHAHPQVAIYPSAFD